MRAIFLFIDQVLIQVFIYIIIASVVLSWLVAFNVVNPYNPFMRTLWNFFETITGPFLRPIRRWLPDLGGIDISPLILILGLILIRYIINVEILPRLP
jgi:YggT family protein